MRIFDAAGWTLCAVAGTEKLLELGLNPFMAGLLGMLSSIGGGIAHDLLLTDLPMVLRGDLYAVAALADGIVVVIGETMCNCAPP